MKKVTALFFTGFNVSHLFFLNSTQHFNQCLEIELLMINLFSDKFNMNTLKENILRTLLYYDIFRHPLNPDEIFSLLPQNSVSNTDVSTALRECTNENIDVGSKENFYFIGENKEYIDLRKSREKFSLKEWKIARLVTHIIKRFPFVRAVFITGTLSKNSSAPGSDLDFMVVTKENRLWISRTLLMLFKKIFLFNSHKYFCINYFVSENSLEIEEKNIFTATEIIHIKSTFNTYLMNKFLEANTWIRNYFPNYCSSNPYFHSSGFKVNNTDSKIKKVFELIFYGKPGDLLDEYFRKKTTDHWKNKFYYVDEEERGQMFKSTINVSKTHPGNMQKVILENYKLRLKKFNLDYLE